MPTVVMVDAMTGTEVEDALTIGARGFLPKDASLRVLFECLRAVAEGAYWFGNERVRDVVDAFRCVRGETRRATSAGASPRRRLQARPDDQRPAPSQG